MNRREVLKILGGGVGGVAVSTLWPEGLQNVEAASGLPFENGKYQTFPRSWIKIGGTEFPVFLNIDIGTLGPDVDTIVAVDFQGDIPTGALKIYAPPNGQRIEETRVIFIKRASLETVQLRDVLGGDRFDVYQISKYGGNEALDKMARLHAQNTARRHQKVVYLGDLELFEKQWGKQEGVLLTKMIRAQRPARPDLGIPEPNFVNPRKF